VSREPSDEAPTTCTHSCHESCAHFCLSSAYGGAKVAAPSKEGVIYRQGLDAKKWDKEFGSLVDTAIHFYSDEKKSKQVATIDLKIFSVLTKMLDDDPGHDNAWSLAGGNKGLVYLAAETEEDKTDWTKFIARGIMKGRLG